VSAVQEVLASKSLHDCHVACILTNNTFTMAAEELARKNNVVLWGSDKLKEFIEKANQKSNS
jgi:restriction system protein